MNSGSSGNDAVAAGRHYARRRQRVEVFGLAAGAGARRAASAAELGQADVYRAVERDVHMTARVLERRKPARPLQRLHPDFESEIRPLGISQRSR